MATKAKFYIGKVSYQLNTVYEAKPDGTTDYEKGRQAPVLEVEMGAVKGLSGSPEDQFFGAATPLGNIRMTVTTEGAQQFFRDNLGKRVYVTFDEAPD